MSRLFTTVVDSVSDHPAQADARWRPAVLVRALVIACIVPWYLWWAGSGTLLAGFGGDNAIYFLTANLWSPWNEALPAAATVASHSVFPPLYPLVLAITGGGVSLGQAHVVSALLVLLALGAVYHCARSLGLSRNQATLVLVLLAASRVLLLQSLETHSEPLYMILSLAVVAYLAEPEPSTVTLFGVALLAGAAYLTRTFGLTVVAALVAWLALHRPAHGWRVAALAVGIVAGWSLWHAGSAQYAANLRALYASHGIGPQLAVNLDALWRAWLGCFNELDAVGAVRWLPLGLLVPAAYAWGRRLAARTGDALYLLAYGALLVIWPYPAEYERMLLPVLPLLLAYAVQGAAHIAAPRRRLAVALLAALVLTAELPFLLVVQSRLATVPEDPGFAPYLRSQSWFITEPVAAWAAVAYERTIIEAMLEIREEGLVPAGECLLAIKPSVVAAYTGLPVDGPPKVFDDDATLLRDVRGGRCHYLFMTRSGSPTWPWEYFPLTQLGTHLELLVQYRQPFAPANRPAAVLGRLR